MRRVIISLGIGLLVGLAIGLTVGWLVLPVQIVDSPMRDLSPRFKDDYTVMVANGYQVDRDLQMAVDRLSPLDVGNVFTWVRDVTERYISRQGVGRETDIRALVALSCDMGYCTDPMRPFRRPEGVSAPGS